MRKKLLTILVLCSCAAGALAFGSGKSVANGDAYADQFNLHLNAGLHSGITMSVELPLYAYGEQVFTLQDTVNESEVAGYVYNGFTIVDSAQVDSAFLVLNEGIKAYPNRLDLYFGLATAYLYCLDIERMLNVLEAAMKQEKKNKGKWLWTADEKMSKDYDLMFDRVQEDLKRFLDAEDLDHAERLARMAVHYYPKRAEYMNDLGVIFVYRENLEEALRCYKQALQLNPKDELIQGNVEYLEQVLKHEDL